MQTENQLEKDDAFDANSAQDLKLSKKYPSEIPNEMIENQTKKIPNLAFLAFAGAAIGTSAILTWKSNKKTLGNFVGLWAPTIMILGLYNKMVKVEDEVLASAKEIKNLH
jgi:hypothetical protein